MILSVDGAFHHGAAALTAIAALSTPVSPLNRINRHLFRSQAVAHWTYPLLVGGRNLLLRLFGRQGIA
jgi:hypothetical protein